MKRLTSLVATVGSPLPRVACPWSSPTPHPQGKPVDVGGKWALTVETSWRYRTPSVELKQDGETLTGTYSSQVFGEQKVTGTIKDNAITFGFKTSFRAGT